ncbi:MAG: LysM peptidoglycan-binding domain-containing protein [Lachnospiraceae bacterium]|nr:LysM peptidoglycan-binding domain-containing protein [Lachnospiraceae bacterium]
MKKFVIFIAIVATFFLAVMIIAANTVGTSAKNSPTTENARFSSYEICVNDSLWSIASKYAPEFGLSTEAYVRELKQVNQLQGDRIIAGNKLIILYKAK